MPLTSRRTLFGTAAAIATAQFPILGANDRINVGIVGIGGRGRDHIDYYSTLDSDCRIAAVCDVNQAGAGARRRAGAASSRATSPKQYRATCAAMFESKDIDAVSVATPNHWHALATIWACQAGKDVYVEKPASHNIFEGRKMVEAARKYKRMVQVGSQSRSIAHKVKRHPDASARASSARSTSARACASAGASPSAARRTSRCRPASTGTRSSGRRR